MACCPGFAQTSGSIALLSDYRYRGVSFSDERPTLRLGISHDTSEGWYAGASLVGVSLDPGRQQMQLLGYFGYAERWSEALGWEAGLIAVHFSADSKFDYQEWFGGLQGEGWTLRLHLAPDYFGSGTRTLYADFGVGLPLSRFMRATAHGGALVRVGGAAGDGQRPQFDTSLGLGMSHDAWELQLEWVAGGRSGIYPVTYGRVRGAPVLSVSHPF
jgi:uncharacterized protein (TIGR02001 family)